MKIRTARVGIACGITAALIVAAGSTVRAQLDPLLFLKRVPPTVIVVVDTSMRMMEDGEGDYYDPNTYVVANDLTAALAFGLDTATQTTYLRRIRNLQFESTQDANTRFEAQDILAVPNTAAAYGSFFKNTRFEMARLGVRQAVAENTDVRWSLIKTRQASPDWRTAGACDKPVRVTGNASLIAASDTSPCNAGALGRYGAYVPTVSGANFSQSTAPAGTVMVQAAGGTAPSVVTILNRGINNAENAAKLVPAGRGTRDYQDRPVSYMLIDARAEAVRAMGADTAAMRTCRNTVVVLLTSGANAGDSTYTSSNSPTTLASQFLAVSGGGTTKRVPVYVVGLKPPGGDEAQLQAIAANSGGAYYRASDVGDVARVLNLAVQAGFSRANDFDTGNPSEFSSVSPIVGTVNLKNASAADNSSLPYTDIWTAASPGLESQPIPQRSNVLLTASFSLPGFDGRLRAFRTYRPDPDSSQASGYKFVADGTTLWPDLDGRPELAGLARLPADPNRRNIYTYIPDGSGGGATVAFTAANAPLLQPHMGLRSEEMTAAIAALRAQPIGAVIGSTPAMMDPPSLDPPPDEAYGRAETPGTFAGDYKDRRSLIFFGANDGMIHAVDARTGYEVWAFIPYNLLPKMRTLLDGQPVQQFDYFVDSSPKIAEVKVNTAAGHRWRSLLIIGQAQGGTFYQAFDVTEAGLGVSPDRGSLSDVEALLQRFDSPDESIRFMWAFPKYSSFDPTYYAELPVTDATPGGKVKMFGDLKATATAAEKSVGFSWSDPAVGPLNDDRTINAVMTGSGYFPGIEDALPGRGAAAPRAGRSFYLLKVEDGTPLANSTGTCNGTGCVDVGASAAGRMKNALQADPSAAGDVGDYVVNKAYIGDLNGTYWRLNFTHMGAMTSNQMVATGQPIFSSSALLFVGSANVYMFFSTGSDLLPTASPQGIGTFKLWGVQDNFPGAGASLKFTRDLATVTNVSGIANGERPSTAPSVAGDIVFYTTTTEAAATPCTSDFSAKLYAFTYLGGAAYDSSGDNRVTAGESPVVRTVAGRATAPFIVDQHLYFGTAGAGGVAVEAFGDPEDFNNGVGQVGVRILSWREIR
jgi:hypothetical protein